MFKLATLPASSSIARGLHGLALVALDFLGRICIYLAKVTPSLKKLEVDLVGGVYYFNNLSSLLLFFLLSLFPFII